MTERVVDEAGAWELLERLRWGGAPGTCPHCGVAGRCYFLRPPAATGRLTRTGRPTARRIWKCGACRRQFTVLTATVLEATKVGLLTWLAVAAATVSDGAVPSPSALSDSFGLTPETARHLSARLGLALGRTAQ